MMMPVPTSAFIIAVLILACLWSHSRAGDLKWEAHRLKMWLGCVRKQRDVARKEADDLRPYAQAWLARRPQDARPATLPAPWQTPVVSVSEVATSTSYRRTPPPAGGAET